MNKVGLFRNKDSIYFIVIIFLFIGGYAFFFTSTLWMPPGSDVSHLTKVGQSQKWNDRTVTIFRWDYCDETKMMEVELDVTNSKFDGKNTYDFEAVEIGGATLEVEIIVEEADWIVLQIENLPKRWSEVSLRMSVRESDEDRLKLYTNVVDVNRVASIETKDINGYRARRFETEILAYQEDINDKNNEIETMQTENVNINSEIRRLEESKTYQTELQIAETNTKISEAYSQIMSNEEKIADLQDEIIELNKRIEMVEKQKEEVLELDE